MVAEKRLIEGVALYRWLTTPPGESGKTLIYEVPLNRMLEIERLEVYFPTGCEGLVEVRITCDGIQAYPYIGTYRGDEVNLVTIARKAFPPGGKILAEWVNRDTLHELAFSLNFSCLEYEAAG